MKTLLIALLIVFSAGAAQAQDSVPYDAHFNSRDAAPGSSDAAWDTKEGRQLMKSHREAAQNTAKLVNTFGQFKSGFSCRTISGLAMAGKEAAILHCNLSTKAYYFNAQAPTLATKLVCISGC